MRKLNPVSRQYQLVKLRWETTYTWALGQEKEILNDIISRKQKFINVFNDFGELMFSTGISNTDLDAVQCAIDKKLSQTT